MLDLAMASWIRPQKHRQQKKTQKLDFIMIKDVFVFIKGHNTIHRVKLTEQEIIFVNGISDRGSKPLFPSWF